MKTRYFLNPIFSLIVFVFCSQELLAQVEDVQLYKFAHSLIDHRPPAIETPSDETTIAHWIYDIAEHTGKTFATTGQFGQLANHVDGLPPDSNLGYDNPPYSWDQEQSTFAQSSLNTIMLTAANFIQYSDPSEADPADPEGRTVIGLTESIFDWTDNEKPNMRYYIYGNWPEMDLTNAFPPTLPFQSEVDEFHNITIGNIGPFADWWTRYQDLMIESRPELETKLIPVGMIISKLLTEVIPNQIPFDELYEDSAPHGRANIYFLAGMISYMALYEENIPSTYNPSDLIHPAISDNLQSISNYAWDELHNFNFPSGDSRVFYATISNVAEDQILDNPKIKIWPNPVLEYFEIYGLDYNQYILQIKNVEGKLFEQSTFTGNQKEIETHNYPSGIYIVQLQNIESGTILTDRFIKR